MISFYRNLPLRLKLVTLVTLLIIGVAVVLLYYFPLRFEERARALVQSRAQSVTEIMAALDTSTVDLKLAPEDSVKDLALLSSTQGAIYAVSRTSDGKDFGVWNPRNVPIAAGGQTGARLAGGLLHVTVPMTKDDGKGGKLAVGSLTVGFSVDELQAEKKAAKQIVMVASMIIVVLGILVSFLIGTVLVRPIQKMTEVAAGIARGELAHADLQVGGTDEVGRMAQAFDRMLSSLRGLAGAADRVARGDLTERLSLEGQVAESFNRMVEEQQAIVRQIAETSSQLAGAAAEIYAASQEQEAAASQQAGGMEEVRRTMQSLLDAAAHISDSARGVLTNAEKTRDNNDSMAGKIAELSAHTNRMTEILDVIRDIADRSDLLALNASLEATRAGEGGRAFSLVATEMRRLAERVTASVSDVKSLVSDVRSSGSSTVMATEEGRKLAESTTISARQITMVTQQQRTGTEQVTQSMQDISTVLAQSVAASQQTRASAENLKNQAERLAEMVGRFKLEAPSGRRMASESDTPLLAAAAGGTPKKG